MTEDLRIAIVLPAYNLASNVGPTLRNVAQGIAQFPSIDFEVHMIDDGSPDGETWDAIQAFGKHFIGDGFKPHRNEENQGLVATLKQSYARVLASRFQPTHTLKTDVDREFDQAEVVQKLVDRAPEDVDLVVGARWRQFGVDENLYEVVRRRDFEHVLATELGLIGVDPVYCGSQLIRRSHLAHLLANEHVQQHTERWGLDTHILMLTAAQGKPLEIIRMEQGIYDVARRDVTKVRTQFDTYTRKLAVILGKEPHELTGLYELSGPEDAPPEVAT